MSIGDTAVVDTEANIPHGWAGFWLHRLSVQQVYLHIRLGFAAEFIADGI